MPLRDVIKALYGTFRLALLDPGGLEQLDQSATGFWRSFYAAVLIAPLFGLLLVLRHSYGLDEGNLVRFLFVEFTSYVIVWTVFPQILSVICKVMDRQDRFITTIVAYNWSAVWQNLLYLPIAILGTVGFLSDDLANELGFIALIMILFYTGYIIKTALNVPVITAACIVSIDMAVAILVNTIALSLH